MNEPAMFCTPEGVAELKEYIKDNFMDNEETSGFVLGAKVKDLQIIRKITNASITM